MASPRTRIRIVLADDHPLVREGLRQLLDRERDFAVIGEAPDGREAVALAISLRPDILLVDLAMPRAGGLEALQDLREKKSPVRTIVLTAALRRADIVDALRLGARGVVLKDVPTDVLFTSIRAVVSGRYWLVRNSFTDLTRALRSLESGTQQTGSMFSLTPRQLEVVSSVVAGLTNKEIAARLAVSEQTVKHHLTQIFDKVGVSSRLELAVFATHHGLGS